MRKITKKQLFIIVPTFIILILGLIIYFKNLDKKYIQTEYSKLDGEHLNNVTEFTEDSTTVENEVNDLIDVNIVESVQEEIKTEEQMTEVAEKVDISSNINNTQTTKQQNVSTQTSSSKVEQEKPVQTQITTPTTTAPVQETEPTQVTTPTANKTETPVEKPSIKTISQTEFDNAVSTFLADIKSTKPGLKCSYKKTSTAQVFWPYRKTEISVFTKNISFGTIYYYVEKFVESNEEKLKFYIDWAGN